MSPDEFYARLEQHAKQTKTTTGYETESIGKKFEPGQAKVDTLTGSNKNVSINSILIIYKTRYSAAYTVQCKYLL